MDDNISEKGKARIWTDYGLELEAECSIHNGKKYAYIPKFNQFVMYPTIIRNSKGEPIVYAPEQTHKGIDREFLIKLAKAQKYKVSLWKKIDETQELLECEFEANGAIDPHIFNNDLSPNMAADSLNVMRSKIMEFLHDMTDREKFTNIIFGFLMGIPAGGFLLMLGYMVFGK